MTTVTAHRKTIWQRLLAASMLLTILPASTPATEDDAAKDSTAVKLRDLTLSIPGAWKQEEPKSKLRLAQFSIPATKGDKEAAELAVFNFGAGGGIEANIQRWIGQFQPKGRTAKITTGTAPQGKYVFVDLSGTYKKPDGPPIRQKTVDTPGTRALSVILAIENKGLYFLKLVGPQKTVGGQADIFRAAFGGNAKDEKEVSLGGEKPKN